MRWFRIAVIPIVVCVASTVLAYEPSSTSPYTFTGCEICETYSNERVGDGNFHQAGCGQSGPPLYWCDCSIGYAPGEMLQAPVLTVNGNNVTLEYWARNIYCNPPADFGDIHEPNAVSYRIQIVELDPVTLTTIAVRHTMAPYWEHGKVTFTDLSPACKLYRAVYLRDTTFGQTYAVSSDVVGATGNSGGASCLIDIGPCPTCTPGGGAPPTSGVSPGVGKPINVGSGNMYYSEPLFSVAGPGSSTLPFSLSYNSRETNVGALGPGFTHSFDQRLTTLGNHRLWRDPDGSRVLWVLENHPPTGEIRRAVYPGDTTGTMTQGTNLQIRALDGALTEFNTSTGRWVRSADRWGNAITGTYTGADLTSITDAMGRTLTLTYTAGRLTSITDTDGNQWRFAYDGANRLEKVFDPLHTGTTPWRQYTWTGSPAKLATVTDESGAVLEGHQYDAQGRAISSWSGDTVGSPPAPGPNARDLVTLSYDSTTQTTVTSTVDSGVTQSTVYTLQVGSGRFLASSIVGTCVSCGQVEDAAQFTFDNANHPLSRIVGTGLEQVETRYVYDANGMVTSRTEAFGKPEQRVTTYVYGKADWPSFATSMTEASVAKPGQAKVTSFSWNAGETQLTQSVSGFLASTDSSPTVFTTTTSFDAKHRMTQRDGPVSGERSSWSYYGDADANLDRRGRLQQMTLTTTATSTLATTYDNYDVYGTPRLETDANGVDTLRTLDARGRTLTVRSVKPPGDANEPADYVTTSTYDLGDRLTTGTSPLGNQVVYGYEDGTNRLLQTTRVDASGNQRERVVYTLNAIGRKKTESYEDCTTPAVTCSTWVARKTDSFSYNAAGRLTTVTHPGASTMTYGYDTRGNLLSVKDERHAAANTLYVFDPLDRLSSVTQKQTLIAGADIVTSYAYDAHDNLTSVTDPRGNVTTYGFDDFGRMQKQISPVTGTTTYSYDAAGNLLTTVDANGATTTRAYDLANRVLTATSSRSGLPTESVVWTYDASTTGAYGKGRLASMTDPSGSTTYLYERRGLLRSEVRTLAGSGFTTTFGFDANGNRTSTGYPSGRSVTYTFDFADRPLSAASSTTTFVSAATYYPFGSFKTLTYGNGTVQELTRDDRYLPVMNELRVGATPIASYTYTNDDTGNITGIHDAVQAAWNRDFAYDDLNRLITANSGASLWGTGGYSYDAMGNILTSNLGGSTTSFSYVGTTPKLASVTSGSTTTPVTYDSAGNETLAEVTRAISSRNLVRQIETTGSRHTFVYDGRGIRVLRTDTSKRLSDQSKIYRSVYTPELQLLSTTRTTASFGTPPAPSTTEIVWFGDRPVAQLDATTSTPTVAYTFADHLGTPLLQTNSFAAVTWRAEYEPYGRIYTMRASFADVQPLRFPGQEAAVGGDSYNIFRWYRSSWGRYTQGDLLDSRVPGVNNGYRYALSNPQRWIDPKGLESTHVSDILTCTSNPANCVVNYKCKEQAIKVSKLKFGYDKDGSPQNAYKHCYWNCCMSKQIGAAAAKDISGAHENYVGNPPCSKDMDQWNNEMGSMVMGSASCDQHCSSAPLQNASKCDCKYSPWDKGQWTPAPPTAPQNCAWVNGRYVCAGTGI